MPYNFSSNFAKNLVDNDIQVIKTIIQADVDNEIRDKRLVSGNAWFSFKKIIFSI